VKQSVPFVVLILASCLAWSAPVNRKAPAKAPAKSSARSSAPAKSGKATKGKTTARWKAPAKGKTAWSRNRRTATPAPRYYAQNAPAPERYREIQQALADKGYYKSEVNGQWGADSVEAMRRFQKDQNLDPSGKLDSLTLIALGLGPKRTASAQVPKPPTLATPQSETQNQ